MTQARFILFFLSVSFRSVNSFNKTFTQFTKNIWKTKNEKYDLSNNVYHLKCLYFLQLPSVDVVLRCSEVKQQADKQTKKTTRSKFKVHRATEGAGCRTEATTVHWLGPPEGSTLPPMEKKKRYPQVRPINQSPLSYFAYLL